MVKFSSFLHVKILRTEFKFSDGSVYPTGLIQANLKHLKDCYISNNWVHNDAMLFTPRSFYIREDIYYQEPLHDVIFIRTRVISNVFQNGLLDHFFNLNIECSHFENNRGGNALFHVNYDQIFRDGCQNNYIFAHLKNSKFISNSCDYILTPQSYQKHFTRQTCGSGNRVDGGTYFSFF